MKRRILYILIIAVTILGCKAKSENTSEQKTILSTSLEEIEFEDWFRIHNDRFLGVNFENKSTLKKTYYLKKQFGTLYLVEAHEMPLLNFFPLLENHSETSVLEEQQVLAIFPSPNVLKKDLIIRSWLNEKKDTLYADFIYSYRAPHITFDPENPPPPMKSKGYKHKIKLALVSGEIYISLGKDDSSLW